ncbi:PREDICTED: uncharacterized protein LOC108514001 isoform X3 [Rhinopithecus bieti]|uniref:uncharacterized protein LOC108514001 isoform X3 n=1 Tax=Rhinopithecus bieti TaxID=61621 RepID=UPI00083C7DE6|nr:PREDICTED: uncharacterized protein LOC108514001 isoform X3 [Rhinopithecus bieti]
MAHEPVRLQSTPAGPQPPWWDQHRCRAEGSRGAPDVWLPSSVCPCWAAAGVTSTVLLFLARPMTQERPCGRGATYKPGREASPETNRDGAFILDCSLQNSSVPAASVPAASVPAASVPAACTLSPALQGSGGQDSTGDNRASGGPTQAEASGPVEGQGLENSPSPGREARGSYAHPLSPPPPAGLTPASVTHLSTPAGIAWQQRGTGQTPAGTVCVHYTVLLLWCGEDKSAQTQHHEAGSPEVGGPWGGRPRPSGHPLLPLPPSAALGRGCCRCRPCWNPQF